MIKYMFTCVSATIHDSIQKLVDVSTSIVRASSAKIFLQGTGCRSNRERESGIISSESNQSTSSFEEIYKVRLLVHCNSNLPNPQL